MEISKKEAEKLISAWHNKFKDASSFLNRCNSSFLKTGLLCTPWGRRRRLHRLFSDDYINAAKGREGQNFIIQGFAAELAFKALIDIFPDKFIKHLLNSFEEVCKDNSVASCGFKSVEKM